MNKPVIGITVTFDQGGAADLMPGRPLNYVSAHVPGSVEYFGGLPVLVPAAGDQTLKDILQRLDGIVVTGGIRSLPPEAYASETLPGLEGQCPERYRYDRKLIEMALDMNIPLLGICRGHQMLNEVTGGSLCLKLGEYQKHRGEDGNGARHNIEIEPGTLLQEISGGGKLMVNSFHAQAVERTGPGMVVSSRSPDGAVESIESTRHSFAVGVQFHPELTPPEDPACKIIQCFCQACRKPR